MNRRKTSPIWKISKNDLVNIVSLSKTYTQVLKHFGFPNKGSNIRTLKQRLQTDQIKTTHFDPHAARAAFLQQRGMKERIPWEQVLVKDSKHTLKDRRKARLIKEGLLIEKFAFENCESPLPLWKGEPLTLILDHINGIRNDHRPENLRLICPNCNSQLDTHCGKNRKRTKKIYRCQKCQTPIKTKEATHCKSCGGVARFGIKWPSVDNLIAMVESLSMTKVAAKLGCSDRAVKKHIIKYRPNWASNYKPIPPKKVKK